MAEDEELEEIRRRKLVELQQRLAQVQQKGEVRRLEIQKQPMPVPEVRKRLTDLKTARPEVPSIEEEKEREEEKGYPTERREEEKEHGKIDAFQISEYLRTKLKEIEAEIEPTSTLPKLHERKERLEEDMHQEQEKIAEIEDLIPRLEQEKRDLQENMKRNQEEVSRIYAIELILQKAFSISKGSQKNGSRRRPQSKRRKKRRQRRR